MDEQEMEGVVTGEEWGGEEEVSMLDCIYCVGGLQTLLSGVGTMVR